MTVRAMIPTHGMTTADRRTGGEADNPLARLIRIVRQNDELLGRLEVQGRRLARARDYAADPESNPALGEALVAHARRGFVHILSVLRANRAEALEILRACGRAEVSEAS
jgi:hypothetical protein